MMFKSILSSLASAINAVGRGIDAALAAVAGTVLSAASAIAPKAPPAPTPPSPPADTPNHAGICPGGRHWRGPFPQWLDADAYAMDIPVPTTIHKFDDGWWLYVPDTEPDAGEVDWDDL